MASSFNQAILKKSKDEIATRYPSFASELFSFLERDESKICFAKKWQHDLCALRVAPSKAIADQFDISLEIPLLLATFTGKAGLEPRVLRHLDTSTELRKSTTADKDIAILVASDKGAGDFVKDRKRFSYPILPIYTDGLEAGQYSHTSLRAEIAKLMRSMNHFDNSNEIREAADFFGRVDDLEALTSLAVSGQSVGVFGLRRAGKTSLLYRVADALRVRGIESIYVQLNAMADADHLREHLVESTARLVSRIGGRVPENSEMLNKDFTVLTSSELRRRWVYEMDALLDQVDSEVVILLDETDLANEESLDFDEVDRDDRQNMNRVLQQLRGVIQIRNERGKRRLLLLAAGVAASIFTSSLRFGRDNQLFGFASARPLGPMSRNEMRQMVRVLGKRSGLRFDGHLLFNSLFDEYGGHPHLTRQACARVAEDVHNRQVEQVPYHVTLRDLQVVYESAAESSPARSAWETFLSFQRWYPEESERVELLIRDGRTPAVDEIPHAVDFGICDAQGQLRLGALRREARRELD